MRRVSTLTCELLAVASLAPVLLRLPPERLARLLEPRRPGVGRGGSDPAELVRVADAVVARARPFVRRGCLTRGLTRYRALRHAGVDVALCFGVGSIDGTIEAHCWLVHEGAALFEPEDVDRFVEMFRICAPGVVRTAP